MRSTADQDDIEEVYLVGVRLRPDSDGADLYTLVLYYEAAREEQNRPLTSNGRIVFFESPFEASQALTLGDAAFQRHAPVDPTAAHVYDLPQILDLVARADYDEPAVIADFINELLDFVSATTYPLPEYHRATLAALADGTTFDKDFGRLFATGRLKRSDAVNALLWAVGAVFASANVME